MDFWTMPDRKIILGISIALGFSFVGIMTVALDLFKLEMASVVLLDRHTNIFVYPFTIQNLMFMLFFVGLGELFIRWRVSLKEMTYMGLGLLPEDDETVLQTHDLGPIRKSVAKEFDGDNGFLPSLINICILQLHSSRSIDQVVNVLNSSLELIAHRVDLRYSMVRYIVWVIPTIGFIGTVVGISWTLNSINAPQASDLLQSLTSKLAVSFNTTLVALILSAILVFLVHVVQAMEERAVNNAGNYCLQNLANRLYIQEK